MCALVKLVSPFHGGGRSLTGRDTSHDFVAELDNFEKASIEVMTE